MKPIPLGEKDILTPEEATRHFGFSRRKFYRWIEKPHGFVAYFRTREIILRAELERYFLRHPEEREAMASPGKRRDSKHCVLRRGESIRADGKYQFKYHVDGKPRFVYS